MSCFEVRAIFPGKSMEAGTARGRERGCPMAEAARRIEETGEPERSPVARRKERGRGLAVAGLALALAAVALAVSAGPGSRAGLWHFRTGFSLLRLAGWTGVAAVIVSGLAGYRALDRAGWRTLVLSMAALLAGVFVAGSMWGLRQAMRSAPRIHDITTDTANPPAFAAVLPLRKDAANSPAYGGEAVAAAQRAAYPDIGPLVLPAAPGDVFDDALAAARQMGWEVVAASPGDGRIEAVATTRWFGFRDDVVVRVAPRDGGTRVDVRSASRVGASDAGTNARRIRAYLEKVEGRGP